MINFRLGFETLSDKINERSKKRSGSQKVTHSYNKVNEILMNHTNP